MPKHEALTPKAIANRIKAKGLQKLRWYCQMCQKQCRDENGFKCHTMSESHQRQLLLFADSPRKYLDTFSSEFKDGFLELLRRRFGTKRVQANVVYQEYIQDRHHLHMNATRWVTLTQFVKWLGREGKCTVDVTEKGWFITYIDRDPETIRRQEAVAKKEKMDKDDNERLLSFIKKQAKRVKEGGTGTDNDDESTYTELVKNSEDEKIQFKIPIGSAPKSKETAETLQRTNPLLNASKSSDKGSLEEKQLDSKKGGDKRKMNLEELMEEEERKKEKINRKDYWLAKGVVVKIMTKALGDKYFKKKGVIKEVADRYIGVVQMVDTNDVLKLDQAHLETVIPAIGRRVLIVNGAYRNHTAVLLSLDEKHFACNVKIDSGPLQGRVVEHIQYDDLSKLHQDS